LREQGAVPETRFRARSRACGALPALCGLRLWRFARHLPRRLPSQASPNSRCLPSKRKSDSVCVSISWHRVSRRRPGAQGVMRANARPDAIPIPYRYGQIPASSRGEKHGRPAKPSRDSIVFSQALKSNFPTSFHGARARWPAGIGASTSAAAQRVRRNVLAEPGGDLFSVPLAGGSVGNETRPPGSRHFHAAQPSPPRGMVHSTIDDR
jgi:hypothetical protein